jgi:hypothetical protein
MKKEKEKVDLLLRQNESEQLSGFDWNRLQASISKRLDHADSDKTLMISHKRVYKLAAGIAAAAAIVFIAVIIKAYLPPKGQFNNGDEVMVTFVESKGSAKVEILESNEQGNRRKDRPAWIIIRKSEPKMVDNRHSRDEADFACLM